MADSITRYKVFIASPGGLQDERQAFRNTIREYNEEIDQQRREQAQTPPHKLSYTDFCLGCREDCPNDPIREE